MLQVKVVQESSADSHTAFQELPAKSLTASNIPGRNSTESPREGLRAKRAYPASSPAAGPDPTNNENCRVQWSVHSGFWKVALLKGACLWGLVLSQGHIMYH